MKFLKVWQGVVTGSLGGREDGFPETKFRVYNDMTSLAQDFKTKKDEQYFTLTEFTADSIKEEVETIKQNLKRDQVLKERENKINELNEINMFFVGK